jgi:hypothetical protein
MTATTKTDCQATGMCRYDSLIRPRFFDGMLLTDESLLAEQTYHREALKRVNRYMYGSGILCGLQVEWVSGLCIRIQPGAALDCQGNFIELCRCVTIDLTETCKECYPGSCLPADTKDIVRYLAVRYADIGADPQPVLASDDECASASQGTKCQTSKTREGFCFELLDHCPEADTCLDRVGLLSTFLEAREEAHTKHVAMAQAAATAGPAAGAPTSPPAAPSHAPAAPSTEPTAMQRLEKPLSMEQSPACPACDCGDKFVGLAKLTINCGKSTVTVDPGCRSYVWTPRLVRTVLCKVLAALDKRLNQAATVTEERRFPKVEQFLRDPVEGVRRALLHFATEPDWQRSVGQPINQIHHPIATPQAAQPAAAPRPPRARRTPRAPGAGPAGPPPAP